MPNTVQKRGSLLVTRRYLHLAAASLLFEFAVVNLIITFKEDRNG